MKLFLVLTLSLLSVPSFASCPDMAKKVVTSNKKSVTVTSNSYRQFYSTVKHYRTEMMSDFPARIEELNSYKKGSKTTGYEVIISDGGDESTIRYVLNADKKLVVAYWYNQSPMTYWFCGDSVAQDNEYTEDGTEI